MRECLRLLASAPWLLTAAAAAAPADGHGSPPKAADVVATRASAPIVVDGRLDDAAWRAAAPAMDFRQRDPDEGKPATESTELRIAYDNEALYVGARMRDREPKRIVRRLSRRDGSADADRIRIYLDPRHDHLTGVVFEVSSGNVQGDSAIFNDSWDDSSWDGVWTSAVTLDNEGWTAELRIPFSELRFRAAERQTWGINAERYIQRKNESDWLELVPKKESGLASRMAHLTGLDGLHPRRHLALLPYAVARSELVSPAVGDPFNDGSRMFGSTGLDVKYGLTSNLTLDATVNPDFGQVEVDPAVVNLSDFETFFEEKRPFFIEGSQIFGNFGHNGANNFWGFNRSEPDLFYSRRIGRPPQGETDGTFVSRPSAATILGAAKVTGKIAGGWSVGILEAVTQRESAQLADGPARRAQEIEPLTNYFVGRAHREASRGGLGVMATSVLRNFREPALRDFLAGQAWVGGIDGYVFLDKKKDWVVTGRVAASRLDGSAAAIEGIQRSAQHYFQRPDARTVRLDPSATSLSGWTGAVNLNRQGGRIRFNGALWGVSPGFESNDLGFNSRTDRWGGHAVVDFRKTDPDRFTRSRFFAVGKWYVFNFDRERQGDGLHAFGEVQLRNYWSAFLGVFKTWRVEDDRLTRGGPSSLQGAAKGTFLTLRTDSRKPVSGRLQGEYESNEFGGWNASTQATLELKPLPSLFVSLGPSLLRSHNPAQWVTSVDDPTALATFGGRYVFADLTQTELSMTTRLNWILSPNVSLQVYAQPLISVGKYRAFKELARPRSFDFLRYGTDAGSLAYDDTGSLYSVDPDGPGPAPAFTFNQPNFNFKSVRVNAIFRWEWRPGSTLYVAWTQKREDTADPGVFEFRHDLHGLFSAPADDVLLVKASYRFGR
ncbi:MAG: hypothetical protein DMF83_25480 [Acidobacteria bacterium]|nr:MAG: hypothetical protein DMF83_25480 [Acidobacteriota bacterium]